MGFGPSNIGGDEKKSDCGYKSQKQHDLAGGWMCCTRAKDVTKVFGLRLEGWTDY